MCNNFFRMSCKLWLRLLCVALSSHCSGHWLILLCRSSKQVPHLNKSAWNMNSAISSSSLLESAHTLPVMVYMPAFDFAFKELFCVVTNESASFGSVIVENPLNIVFPTSQVTTRGIFFSASLTRGILRLICSLFPTYLFLNLQRWW